MLVLFTIRRKCASNSKMRGSIAVKEAALGILPLRAPAF